MTDNRDRTRPLIALTLSRVGHGVISELARIQGVSRSAVVEIAIRKEALALGLDLDEIAAKVESGEIEVAAGRGKPGTGNVKLKSKKGKRTPKRRAK